VAPARPVLVLVSYLPAPRRERTLAALLRRHWPALRQAGLVTARPAQLWRARDKRTSKPFFVELFEWRSAAASDAAHRTPEIQAIWGPMEELLEGMSIAVLEPGPPVRPLQVRRPRRPRRR
jgi:quinol monooxygenase YgiN